MTFKNALKKLDIEDYGQKIMNSNSHGELLHLSDYILLAHLDDVSWFRQWFVDLVKEAEKTWNRPESVFQHVLRILEESLSS